MRRSSSGSPPEGGGYIVVEKALFHDREIGLALSDIVLQPFFAAEELGIPSLGISNITRYLTYTHLFGKTKPTDRIAEAYRAADGALLLPFDEQMGIFCGQRQVGLMARPMSRNLMEIWRLCGLSEGETLAYLGGR